MKRFLIPAFMLCSLTFSSCATVFCGTKAQVTFESNVSEATLTIDGRKHKNVTFPYTTDVERGFDETIVKAEAEGYETTMVYVDKVLNPVSIINLTDVLGWAIDVATGAVTKPEYKVYEIELMKLKPIEE
ncbi:MAG: hypothetical protein J6Q28_03030 [Alistipes sp.]|jgi:hypothetical protein|nr:hypothetical protein [Alistipes sp.]